MLNWLKKYVDPYIKLYSIIPLISAFALNMLVYNGSIFLTQGRSKLDFTTAFDNAVPTIPWFIYIYFAAFIFWAINYIMMGHLGKEHLYRFVTADYLSRLICLVFFVLIPTTNIRPDIAGTAWCDHLLRWLYTIDPAANLFPSIHCLVSWFCFIGIRGDSRIPKGYRIFSCVFALAIVVSTQVTKQHFIVDAIAGIAIAELLYFLTHHCSLYKLIMRFFDYINGHLFVSLSSKEKYIGKQEENNI